MRVRCSLLGCASVSEHPACPVCGAAIYDSEYIQIGKLWWLLAAYWGAISIKAFVSRRCDECGKRMWFNDEPCCSDECFSKWIPF